MIALQWRLSAMARPLGILSSAMLGLVFLMIFLSSRRENAMQAAEFVIRGFPAVMPLRNPGDDPPFHRRVRDHPERTLLVQVCALSLVIWVVDVAIIYAMFAAFSLPLSVTAALF
jgi:uncharacterized membrane protein YbhN (UPF0104 family)